MRLIGPYSAFLDRGRRSTWRARRVAVGGRSSPWPWVEVATRWGVVILCRSRPRTWPRNARWDRLALLLTRVRTGRDGPARW